MFELYANKTQLALRKGEPLTSGSVNVYPVRFEFSEDWDGMERVAVFRSGGESRSVVLDADGQCTIPWEVLTSHGRQLSAGVYGTRDGDMALPTVWAGLGFILAGAVPGDDARPPTPEVWRQELDRKGDGMECDGRSLRLKSGDRVLSEVRIAGGAESAAYRFGHGLKQDGPDVSVDAVSDFSGDNTLPMTAAGVQAAVGSIEALLETI